MFEDSSLVESSALALFLVFFSLASFDIAASFFPTSNLLGFSIFCVFSVLVIFSLSIYVIRTDCLY